MKKLAVISLGFLATVAQVIFIREFLVVVYGNELCLGAIFAMWFMGVAMGALVSTRLADRIRDPATAFAAMITLACVILPFQIYCVRVLRAIVGIQTGQLIPFGTMFLSLAVLTLSFSFFVGFIFPVACRLWPDRKGGGSQQIGAVYIMEGVGSIIGGVAFTFLLVLYCSTYQSIFLTSIAVLGISFFLCLVHGKGSRARIVSAVVGCLIVFAVLSWPLGLVNGIERVSVLARWRSFNAAMELVESEDSKYENIALARLADQYNLFGNGQYMEAFPNEYEYAVLANFILTQHPAPKRVLLIGGGLGGLVKDILAYDIEKLDYVELDPELITISIPYLPPPDSTALEDPRVSVHYKDGRYFVKHATGRYDMVILNLPDPSTAMINRFYTREFFEEARAILEPGGVLATAISSSINYFGEEVANYTGSLYRTLHSVFNHVLVTPGTTNHYFATDSPETVTADIPTLIERFERNGKSSEYFTRYHFEILLPPDRVRFVEESLGGWKGARINTDFRPITYYYNLILWDRFSGSRFAGLFSLASRANFGWILVPILLFLLIRTIYQVVRPAGWERYTRFNVCLAICTTGFAAFALEIVFLFAFQNIYGYVYQKIGFVVAVFMAGLVLGGYLMKRRLASGKPAGLPWLVGIELAIVLLAVFVPGAIKLFSLAKVGGMLQSEYLFMAIIFITGLLTGSEFPLASDIYFRMCGTVGVSAGKIDSADHIGAFLGALLTGIILVPVLGIFESCWTIAALNTASAILLILTPGEKITR